MYFIILATAATLFKTGNTTSVGRRCRQGPGAAGGLGRDDICWRSADGAGFLAVPILTGSAAYALSEAFGWRYGLGQSRSAAPILHVIAVSTLVGMQINFMGINPIAALFWTAVINGFLAPSCWCSSCSSPTTRRSWASASTAPHRNFWAGRHRR